MLEFRRNPFVDAHALNRILLDQDRHPGRVLVIAHRGASSEAPENTLSAIQKAIEIGADAVEFDVRSTFDDRLVLMHDEKVNRTTNGKGAVSGMTIGSVRDLDAGYWFAPRFRGERVPKLIEALDLVARGGIVPVVELKDTFDQASSAAPKVVSALKELGLESSAVVIARDPKQIACVKELSPETPTAYVTVYKKEAEKTLGGAADGIFAFWASLSPALVKAAHDMGDFVAAWTLNTSHMRTLARYGVDALVTNDPRTGLRLVGGA